jgi:hypothetical protein
MLLPWCICVLLILSVNRNTRLFDLLEANVFPTRTD